jgi:transposase
MVLNGALPKDVAEYCVHDERAIQKWVKIADEQGFDALKRKKKEGRPPLLNPEQKAEIKAVLEDPNSLEEYGYCVWDGKTLSEFIKKWYDVDISVRNCQYLFHELGQSLKTPQTFPAHPENPKVREDFKKTLRIAEGSKQYHRVSRRGTFPASDKCDTNLVSYWYRSGGWFCAGQRKRCL